MTQILLAGLLNVLGLTCFAQIDKNQFQVGAGISLAVPVYNLDYSSTGGGVGAIVLYGLSDKISLTADVAFIGLPGKSIYPSTAIVPIRLGLRYFPASKIYVGAQAGLGIYTILKASANHTAYAVGAGYMLNKKIDVGLYYDGYSNNKTSFGYAGVRIHYYFLKN